jgi:hypothetical protein
MTPWLNSVTRAIIGDIRQRYELAYLLERLESDHRMLEDLGLDYKQLAEELRRDQREHSPLRSVLRQSRQAAQAGARPSALIRDGWR